MVEQDATVMIWHGRMPTFRCVSRWSGSVPAGHFYMDAPGTREEFCDLVRRIAKQGYFCLLPDMYYRLWGRFTSISGGATTPCRR
jgi:carboxymethylenebutenolidase